MAVLVAYVSPLTAVQLPSDRRPPEAKVHGVAKERQGEARAIERAIADFHGLNESEKDELVMMRPDQSKTDARSWLLFKEAMKDKERVRRMEAQAEADAKIAYRRLPGEEKVALTQQKLDVHTTDRRTWYLWKRARADKERVRAMEKKAPHHAANATAHGALAGKSGQGSVCVDVTVHSRNKYQDCYQTMQWIRIEGFYRSYSQDYTEFGLSKDSPLSDFQQYLYTLGKHSCPKPCSTVDLGLNTSDPKAMYSAYVALHASEQDVDRGWNDLNELEDKATDVFGDMLKVMDESAALAKSFDSSHEAAPPTVA